MDDSEFEISIDVTANLAPFRQQVQAEMEKAAKGVTVPVSVSRGGTGGQGAPVIPGVAAAEQAAVERAVVMAQAQTLALPRTPRGDSASLAMFQTASLSRRVPEGGGGDLFSGARARMGALESSVAGWREDFQQGVSRGGIVDPRIAARVERNWELAQFAQYKAAERAERSAQTLAERVTQRAQRNFDAADFAEYKIQARARATNSDGLDPATDALEAAAWDANWKADKATSRDDMARRRGLRGGGPGGAGVGPGMAWGIPRSGADSPLGAWRYARAIAGALAVTEASSALQAYRSGQSAGRMASTPEEAWLARAQGVDQASSGLVGSVMAFVPNLFDFGPQRDLREAQEAVHYRRMRDETRAMQYQTLESGARRAGLAGSRMGGDIAGIRARAAGEIAPLNDQIRQFQSQLAERTAVVTENVSAGVGGRGFVMTSGGDLVLTGGARTSTEAALGASRNRRTEITAQAEFEIEQLRKARAVSVISSDNRLRRSDMIRGGAGPLALARESIRAKYADSLDSDQWEFGQFEGARRNREGQEGELAGLEVDYSRAVRTDAFRRAVGGFFRAGRVIDQYRQFNRQQGFQRQQLQSLLGNDPEGAAIAGVQGQTDQQVEGSRFLPFGIRQLVQASQRSAGALQERVVRKQYAEQRFETGESLDAATRQSRFRQIGTPESQVSALLDSIVSSGNAESRGLERAGDPKNAVKRRNLTVQQIREAESSYLSSISYGEFAPNAIVGRGSAAGTAKQFKEAEAKVNKDKEGGPTGTGGAEVPGLLKGIWDSIKELVSKDDSATAG